MADLYYIDSGYLTPDSGYYTYIADAAAAPSSQFTLGCEATAIGAVTEATAALSSTLTLSSTGGIGKETTSSLTSPATLNISITKLVEGAASFTSAFAPSLSVVVFKNSFAVLDVPTTLSSIPTVNRSITQTLDTIASLNAMAERTRGISSSQTASFTQTASVSSLAPSSASLTSTSSLTFNGGKLQVISSNLVSSSSMVTLTRILTRNTQLTANSGGRYSAIETSSAQSKFGGKSLSISSFTGITAANATAVWNGTDFKIITYGYTWTSSDGLTWTRATNNLSSNGYGTLFKWNGSAYYGINSNRLFTSTNGTTFTENTPAVDSYSIGAVEHKSGYYYLATYTGLRYAIWRSTTPGGTWTSLVNFGTAGFSIDAQASTQDGTNIIFLFNNGSTTRSVYSSNGTTWTNDLSSSAYAGTQIAFGNGKYAIVSGTRILTSTTVGGTYSLLQTLATTILDIDYDNSKWMVSTRRELYSGTDLVNSSSLTSVKTYDQDSVYNYDAYRGIEYGSGRWLLNNNAETLYSTDGSTWSYNDIEDVLLPGRLVYNRTSGNTDFNDWKTLDFWFYGDGINSVTGILTQTSTVNSNFSQDGWNVIVSNRKASLSVTVGGTATNLNPSSNLTSAQWNHVRIVRNAGVASIYQNGSRVATVSAPTLPTTSNPVFIGSQYSSNTEYIDELLLSDELLTDPSVTSFTVPTAPYTNSTNVDLLLHFDNDAQDDARITVIEQAALTATFSVSAQPSEIQNSSAALTATSTQTATANITASAVGNLTTSVSVTAIVERIQESVAALSGACTFSVVLSGTKDLTGSLTSTSTQTVDYTRTRNSDSAISSAFSPSLIVSAQRTTDIDLELSATLDSYTTVIYSGNANIAAQSSLNTTVARTRSAASSIASSSTLSAVIEKLVSLSAAANSEFTTSVNNIRVRTTGSDTSASFTIEAAIARTKGVSSSLATTSSLTAEIARTKGVSSSLTSSVTVSATALKIQSGNAELTSTVTATSTPVKTATTSVTIASQASQTVQGVITASALIGLTSAFAPAITANVSAARGSDMQATVTLSAIIGSIKQFKPNSILGTNILAPYSYPSITITDAPTGESGDWVPGVAVSIWAKRDETASNYQPLWSLNYGFGIGLVIINNRVYLRQNYDGDEPQANWSAPQNTNWHHYLLLMTSKSGSYQNFRLWIDGQDKGISGTYDVDGRLAPNFNTSNAVTFGNMSVTNLSVTLGNVAGSLDGAVTQFWAGKFTGQQFDNFTPTYFYDNGYVDLAQGRGYYNQLPQPWAYNDLDSPWDSVTFYSEPGQDGYQYTENNKAASQAISQPDIQARTNLSLDTAIVLVTTADLVSTTALTAQSNYRFDISPSLASTVTLSADAVTTRSTASALNSQFTETVTGFRIQTSSAVLTSQSATTALVGNVKPLGAALISTSTFTCEPTEIIAIQGSASLSSQFTLTANVNERQGFIITPSSEFTLTCDATVKPPIRITADLTSQFTVSAALVRLQAFSIALNSQFTQTTATTKIKGVIANLSTVSTLTVRTGLQLQGAATLQVQAFELTQGDILNFAPELTLYVKQETRQRRVLPENRLYDIDSESRTRRVLPESRIITIEQETEVNII